jgi:SAM-dependent methyltransferase
MITPIPFDPQRFHGAAAHYVSGRPPYAAGLARRVAVACGLDGGGTALDLACGPGQLARAFAPYVEQVLAVDPEPEMLAVGRKLSAGLAIRFEQGSSEELGPEMGRFRLVTIGRAFHWMDRVETARRLDTMIEPGGALVLVRTDPLDVPDNAWLADYGAVRDANVAGGIRSRWQRPDWVSHEGVLLDSPFAALERVGVIERLRTPVATLVDRALSMSSTTRTRLGQDGVERLRSGIEAVLAPIAVDGLVTEVVDSTALIARRA